MADSVTLRINGQEVTVPAGATLREAALAAGVHTPTLCWHPQFPTGSNCRACVMELQGSRVLVPSCTREAEAGMVVETDSERVRQARRMVFELLYSQVELGGAPELTAYAAHYGADPHRFDLTAGDRLPGGFGGLPGELHHGSAAADHRPPLQKGRPAERDNPFFIRDYARCILCQRCTEACGVGVQHTFAISVVGRGSGSVIGSGGTGALPDSPCVFCGNCVGACPTGALTALPEYDAGRHGLRPAPAMRWSPATGLVREEVEA